MSEIVAKEHELIPLILPAPQGQSTQPGAAAEAPIKTPDEAIDPPLALEQLVKLTQETPYRRPIIEAIARNTVGLGHTLEAVKGREQDLGDDPEQSLAEHEAWLDACWARDRRLNQPDATRGFSRVKWDEEECGNGYIEVSRNRTTGEIDGLFHLPGHLMRKMLDGSGWVLLPRHGWIGGTIRGNREVVRYYNFGDKVQYDDDGRPVNKVQPGKVWDRNEVLAFQLPTSESRDYGLPRDSQLAIDYLGDKLAASSNVSFFQSSGTPPTVIFVQGEETQEQGRISFKVPRQTAEVINSTLRSDAGKLNRVAIIPVPPGTKTHEVKLGEVSDRDVGFTGYRRDNVRRQLGAFRLQPIFIALVDEGDLSAETQRSMTLEQLFDPEQQSWEGRLNNTILRERTGGAARIKFKRLAVEDGAIRRESSDRLAEAGGITRREHREAHGYPPLPEAAASSTEIMWEGRAYNSAEPEPGQVPHGWNDELVNTGQPAGAQNRAIEDGRGGGPNNQGDDFTSSRPDELPTNTQRAVAKHDGVAHIQPVVVDLTDNLGQLDEDTLRKAIERAHEAAGTVAAQAASANGAPAATTGS